MPSNVIEPEHDSTALEVSRRKFLGLCPVAVASIASTTTLASSSNDTASHSQDSAVLIDLTKCIGCGSCVEACKADNNLPTNYDESYVGNDAELSPDNWSVVKSYNIGDTVQTVKKQCMHCIDPACASVCFMKAIYKTDSGPVVYDPNKCVGCRFCLMACPFGVPKFEWDKSIGQVYKCDMCVDRTSKGLPTACSEACPTGAIAFGTRQELLNEAHNRMSDNPNKYVDHVYGESEIGGTSVLYISDVPFEQLGFVTLGTEPLPEYTWKVTRLIPPVAVGLGAALIALYTRRTRILNEQDGGVNHE